MTVISSGGFLPTDSLNDIIKSNFQSLFLCIAFLLSILNFYLLYNFILARDNLKKHMEDFFIIALVLVFSTIFYFQLYNQPGVGIKPVSAVKFFKIENIGETVSFFPV